MKLFGFGKDKKIIAKKSPLDVIDKNEMTGCLFYLKFNLKSIKINISGKDTDYDCKIAGIDDQNGLFYLTVLGRASISKGDEIELRYGISQVLYYLKTSVKKNDTEHDLCIEYPKIIEHFERRKNPRAVIRKNENIEITLATDLFSGYGALGNLINIGIDGCYWSVTKIVEVSTGKNIPPNPLILKPSTQFAIIKLALPGCGGFELSGKSIHINQSGYTLNCGVAFNKLNSGQYNLIDKFLSERASSPSPPDYLAFLKKYEAEKAAPKEEKKENKEEPGRSTSADTIKTEAKTAEAAASSEKPQEQPVKQEAKAKEEKPARKESILLVLYNIDEIKLIKRVFAVNDFRNDTLVKSCKEALELMTEKSFDLIILDYNIDGALKSDQFIEIIRKHPKLKNLPIAIISHKLDVKEKVKLVNLKISQACFRPINDSSISEMIIKILGE
jgi:CheY-like chemotaxis protein